MGIGIGIVITCILFFPFYQREPSLGEIEAKARDMGMIYKDEVKAILEDQEGADGK